MDDTYKVDVSWGDIRLTHKDEKGETTTIFFNSRDAVDIGLELMKIGMSKVFNKISHNFNSLSVGDI